MAVTDAQLDPANVTYNGLVDGVVAHAAATVAIGKKYIAADGNFPGSSGLLPSGSLVLCTLTSPETWVALSTGQGAAIADSSTGIVHRYSHTSGYKPVYVSLGAIGVVGAAVTSANAQNIPLVTDNPTPIALVGGESTLTAPLVWGGGVIADGGISWSVAGAVSCSAGAQLFSVTGNHITLDGPFGTASICWFGAKGDGTTDNTTAINAALFALGGGRTNKKGGRLYIPGTDANYKITSPLKIRYNDIHLFGDGANSSIYQATSATNGIENSPGTTLYNLHFSDFHLDSAGGQSTGIYALGFNTSTFERLYIYAVVGARTTGFRIGIQLESGFQGAVPVNCYDATVRGCTMYYPQSDANGRCIKMVGTSTNAVTTAAIEHNWFQEFGATTTGICLEISGGSHTITSNIFEYAAEHIKFVIGANTATSNTDVTFNFFEAASNYCVDFENSSGVYGNRVYKNTHASGGSVAVNNPRGTNAVSDLFSNAVGLKFLTSGTTPSVSGYNMFVSNSNGAITFLTDGYVGQMVTILGNDNSTSFVHNPSQLCLAGAVNFTTFMSRDSITFAYQGSAGFWIEVSRSVNH